MRWKSTIIVVPKGSGCSVAQVRPRAQLAASVGDALRLTQVATCSHGRHRTGTQVPASLLCVSLYKILTQSIQATKVLDYRHGMI